MPFSYPDSVKQQVIELALQGLPPAEIERRLPVKVPRATIYSYLQQARDEGVPIAKFKTGQRLDHSQIFFRLALPIALADRVTAAATSRGLLPRALLTELVECVFEDNLVGAVLDD